MSPRILLALLALSVALPACADEPTAARRRNPWVRFNPGAWKRMRIRKETYNREGAISVSSLEETKTQLKQAEEKSFTLDLMSQVSLAGEDLAPRSKQVALTYYGTPVDLQPTVQVLEDTVKVEVEGGEVACRVVVVEANSETQLRTTKLFLDGDMVLRQESVVTNPRENAVAARSTSNVVARNLMHNVLGEQRTMYITYTLTRRTDSIIHAWEHHCPQVPGGLIQGWTKVTDLEGNLQERIVMELVDFGAP
ncbi:MAG: hypothetical protein KDB14_28205 [Planctomycetales bacterium]|nr:hypothetical protein [Planctomycetales bacterium]